MGSGLDRLRVVPWIRFEASGVEAADASFRLRRVSVPLHGGTPQEGLVTIRAGSASSGSGPMPRKGVIRSRGGTPGGWILRAIVLIVTESALYYEWLYSGPPQSCGI